MRYASRWVAPKDMMPANASLDEPGGMSFNARGNLLALMISRRNPDASYTDGVAIFAVKRRTRTLAPVAHTYVPNSDIADNLAFSSDGRLVAIGNSGDDSVPVLRFNRTTGRLHPVPGSPFASGPTPESLAFSPDGGLLAVVNADGKDFSVFSVSKRRGSLRRGPPRHSVGRSGPTVATGLRSVRMGTYSLSALASIPLNLRPTISRG